MLSIYIQGTEEHDYPFIESKSVSLKLVRAAKKIPHTEIPTLSTDADSRTDTILERSRDSPIRTEKRTWSTQKCGLGPR